VLANRSRIEAEFHRRRLRVAAITRASITAKRRMKMMPSTTYAVFYNKELKELMNAPMRDDY